MDILRHSQPNAQLANTPAYWVPRQQPHRRSGLAILPSVGAVPYSPHIIVD